MTRFRLADEDDRLDIFEADQVCLPDDSRPQWNGAVWWLLEQGGNVAAYCAVRASLRTPGGAYLCRAGVTPPYRGKGLQRRMIRLRERWARRMGFHTMLTDTYRNPVSGNNLIKCGYMLWMPDLPWSYPGACYWYKKL